MILPTDIYTLVFTYVNRLEIRPLSKILNETFLDKFCYHPKPHGIVEEYYQRTQTLLTRKSYKNGMLDGNYKMWYPNGQLDVETTYKCDNLNGLYKEWYSNGQMWYESVYKNGIRDGNYKIWHNNGFLEIETTYKNGNLDGNYKKWYYGGVLQIEETYRNGIKNS